MLCDSFHINWHIAKNMVGKKYERVNVDKDAFFREATLRICGSLEIEKALRECLLYIRDFIPASQMCFHIYHRALGIVETVAHATLASSVALSVSTPLSAKARKQVEDQRSIRVKLVDRADDDPVAGPVAKELRTQNLSVLIMDLVLEGEFLGVLSVFNDGKTRFTQRHVRLMSLLNAPFAVSLTNSLRYRELRDIKDMLADDNRFLQNELRRLAGVEIIGASSGLKGVMNQIRQVAPIDSPVLLLGETGTGKEVIASVIHNSSPRQAGPFIKINCGAIPETLMDSELFGHEKGAFTGALRQRRGRFERAHGGTIFLDEIGELPLEAQMRLLRVLQEKEFERVGGINAIKVDIRVIAATHRDLEAMLTEGTFRRDLYFRLRVFPIRLPPLRKRSADIPALVQHFLAKKSREMKLTTVPSPAPGALDRLMAYDWPGNVRELENAVERALIQSPNGPLTFDDLRLQIPDFHEGGEIEADESLELDVAIARHIRRVLDRCGGRVEGERGAAQLMNINPSTLRKRMEKLGIPFGRRAKKGE